MSLTLLSHRLSHLVAPLKKTTSLHNHITDMAVDYKRLKTKKTAGFLNYTCFGEQREGERERETPCACNIECVVNKLRDCWPNASSVLWVKSKLQVFTRCFLTLYLSIMYTTTRKFKVGKKSLMFTKAIFI